MLDAADASTQAAPMGLSRRRADVIWIGDVDADRALDEEDRPFPAALFAAHAEDETDLARRRPPRPLPTAGPGACGSRGPPAPLNPCATCLSSLLRPRTPQTISVRRLGLHHRCFSCWPSRAMRKDRRHVAVTRAETGTSRWPVGNRRRGTLAVEAGMSPAVRAAGGATCTWTSRRRLGVWTLRRRRGAAVSARNVSSPLQHTREGQGSRRRQPRQLEASL